MHSISLRKDAAALPQLLEMLESSSAMNRRVAAEAIGRVGDKSAVPALLKQLGGTIDRILEIRLTYALIEIGDSKSVAKGLEETNPSIRRAALIALDQMDRQAAQARSGNGRTRVAAY